MTEDSLPLAELLAKAGDGDFLRSVAEAVVQLLMETDAEGLIGAGRHERTAERQTYRNGFRDRALDTRLGTLQLRIPKLRQVSYFPPFLDPTLPFHTLRVRNLRPLRPGRPPRRPWSQ
jgi:putative transposase